MTHPPFNDRVVVRVYDPVTTGYTIRTATINGLLDPAFAARFQRSAERDIAKVGDDPSVIDAARVTLQVIDGDVLDPEAIVLL